MQWFFELLSVPFRTWGFNISLCWKITYLTISRNGQFFKPFLKDQCAVCLSIFYSESAYSNYTSFDQKRFPRIWDNCKEILLFGDNLYAIWKEG